MDALAISIADWAVTLVLGGCSPEMRARLADHYAAFVVPVHPDALTVDVGVKPGPAYIPMGSSPTWQVRSAARGDRVEFESFLEQGWFDWKNRRGSLVMRPEGDPENFLRVVYAWRCFQDNALLLHASGIIREGRGYVFFGPSGSGKTTVTRLSQRYTILSDDLVILKPQNGKWRVFGVPFRGALPEAPRTNMAAGLTGLFALFKGSEHRVMPMPSAEAVARLAACVPFVMRLPDNARRVTENCAALNAAVPARALHFSQDSGFWEVLDGSR